MSDFHEINAILKRRYETGDYGHAHFTMPAALFTAMRESAPPPAPARYGQPDPLGDMLGIPVVVDEELPANTWRLVDNSSGEVLFEGQHG